MVHCYVLLGGIGGPDGYFDSAGMEALAVRLKEYANVTTYPWDQWTSAIAPIDKALGKIVVIGYSGGGSRATWLAANLAHPGIDLLIGYDPSPAHQVRPLVNVKRAICYHNEVQDLFVPFIGKLGGGKYVGSCPIKTIEISEPHLLVQADEHLHQCTIEAVRALK